MPAFVALLRAVNVPRRVAPMATVREALQEAGFTEVQTHIQSGNVRLRTTLRRPDAVADRVREVLSTRLCFDVPAVVRRPAALRELVAAVDALPDPYPAGHSYVAFLTTGLSPAAAAELDAWDRPGEWVRVVGPHVLLRLGVSAHEARISNARIERSGVPATTRDLRVVRALASMWGA